MSMTAAHLVAARPRENVLFIPLNITYIIYCYLRMLPRCVRLVPQLRIRLPPASLSLELAQHAPGAHEVVIEDLAGDIQQLSNEGIS
jgi:hypothetical protein